MAERKTPIYGFGYPRETGLVKVGAKDIEELALKVDAVLLEITQASYETGDLRATTHTAAPTGWLLCNGQAVSRTTYAALFSEIGTTSGEGDKSTTFNVPDARNRMLVGAGPAPLGSATFVLGKTGGVESVTLTAVQSGVSSHVHGYAKLLLQPGNLGAAVRSSTGETGAHVHIPGSQREGSVQSAELAAAAAHENMPPYVVGNWLIKT